MGDRSGDIGEFDTLLIQMGQTTSFTADFTPDKQGGTGRYVLPPVADEVEADYGSESEA